MNAQNTNTKILRESKNRIRVDFERTPLKDRLKARFLNVAFLTKVVVYIFRLLLLIGISYVVLYPFIAKICASFMAGQDFIDATVRLIPKNFTLEQYQKIISELGYFDAFKNTFILSFSCAVFQSQDTGHYFCGAGIRARCVTFFLIKYPAGIPIHENCG